MFMDILAYTYIPVIQQWHSAVPTALHGPQQGCRPQDQPHWQPKPSRGRQNLQNQSLHDLRTYKNMLTYNNSNLQLTLPLTLSSFNLSFLPLSL